MSEKHHIYFASDLHLGMQPAEKSLRREKLFVQWLEEIRRDAAELWLLGDVFDYWFEYKKVVPRGFTRLLGTLASLSDEGVQLHLIPGNHDIWVFDYLPGEINLKVHRKPVRKVWNNHHFLLGHGDGLHPGDRTYRMLQGIFKSRLIQWFYARIHPNGSMTFAHWWSKKSRMKHRPPGRRHIPYDIRIAENNRVICLGDRIGNFTYGVFDGKGEIIRL
jgi:UDP-2,3-diacylglucosamine hydrolase